MAGHCESHPEVIQHLTEVKAEVRSMPDKITIAITNAFKERDFNKKDTLRLELAIFSVVIAVVSNLDKILKLLGLER